MKGFNDGLPSTILEDIDSDLDVSGDALNYNYDVIDLKEASNPFHETIKDILNIYIERNDEESFNPEAALQSP